MHFGTAGHAVGGRERNGAYLGPAKVLSDLGDHFLVLPSQGEEDLYCVEDLGKAVRWKLGVHNRSSNLDDPTNALGVTHLGAPSWLLGSS